MPDQPRNWKTKFQDAFRGVRVAWCSGKSFRVHFFFTFAVIVAGLVCGVTSTEWQLLALCIMSVLTAETFNSALESLAKSVTQEHDENVGMALDIAAGAVLITAIGSAIVGGTIFLRYVAW